MLGKYTARTAVCTAMDRLGGQPDLQGCHMLTADTNVGGKDKDVTVRTVAFEKWMEEEETLGRKGQCCV